MISTLEYFLSVTYIIEVCRSQLNFPTGNAASNSIWHLNATHEAKVKWNTRKDVQGEN